MKFRWYQILDCICGIFGYSEAIPFAGKTVIPLGDLFKLLSVRESFVIS